MTPLQNQQIRNIIKNEMDQKLREAHDRWGNPNMFPGLAEVENDATTPEAYNGYFVEMTKIREQYRILMQAVADIKA